MFCVEVLSNVWAENAYPRNSALMSPAPPPAHAYSRPPLRVLASGTLFLTHTLLVPAYPPPGGAARAQRVHSTRGGHSANVLAVLAQFRATRPHVPPVPPHHAFGAAPAVAGARSVGNVHFCGPLAGNEEGALVVNELEALGVATNFSVVRDGKGVPAAWVIESGQYYLYRTRMRSFADPPCPYSRRHQNRHVRPPILLPLACQRVHHALLKSPLLSHSNHNPLPDMTHDEFVARLGPILAPENYAPSSPPQPPASGHAPYGSPPGGHLQPPYPYPSWSVPGMPPFDWMHFEGRGVQTTLANITGLDGLARERGWRARCVFSLGITRSGVEPVCYLSIS
jgi:hypothetical protein